MVHVSIGMSYLLLSTFIAKFRRKNRTRLFQRFFFLLSVVSFIIDSPFILCFQFDLCILSSRFCATYASINGDGRPLKLRQNRKSWTHENNGVGSVCVCVRLKRANRRLDATIRRSISVQCSFHNALRDEGSHRSHVNSVFVAVVPFNFCVFDRPWTIPSACRKMTIFSSGHDPNELRAML